MALFRSDLFRSFAIGFALGAAALGANLSGIAEAAGNTISAARR